jgi:protein-disulfide isomerase
MKNPWIIVGIIAVLLIGGSIWYAGVSSEQYNEGITVAPHIKGNPDAAVTLLEYSDFQCPACAQFQPYVDDILAQYGDQLRFEYKHFPLMQIHPLAEPAARAAEAAGQQGKFFEFHDLLFINQDEWSKTINPAPFFVKYAESLSLDMEAFAKAQRSSLLRERIQADFAEARSLGLTGTPSFYLNGERMQFQTFDEFRAQIDAAINPTLDLGAPVVDITNEGTEAAPAPVVEFGI